MLLEGWTAHLRHDRAGTRFSPPGVTAENFIVIIWPHRSHWALSHFLGSSRSQEWLVASLDGCSPLQQLTFGMMVPFKPKGLNAAPFSENKSQAKPSAGLWRTQLVFSVSPLRVWRSTDGWGWHTRGQLDPQLSPGTHVGAFTSQHLPFSQISSAEVLLALQAALVAVKTEICSQQTTELPNSGLFCQRGLPVPGVSVFRWSAEHKCLVLSHLS